MNATTFHTIQYAVCTHQGLKKKSNQDRFFARQYANESSLFAVIDGLGGQAGGEEAAEIAVDVLTKYSPEEDISPAALVSLMQKINSSIIDMGNENSDLYGMGAAALIVQVRKTEVCWAHVGDCRLYYLHNQQLQLLTEDQNLAWELYAEGKITEEERQHHPLNCFLSQCLGEDDIEPTAGCFSISPGDRIVLCTDGIHDELSKEQIESIVLPNPPIEKLAKKLCNAALKAGGKDNITLFTIEAKQ